MLWSKSGTFFVHIFLCDARAFILCNVFVQASLSQLDSSCNATLAEISALKETTRRLDEDVARARQELTRKQVSHLHEGDDAERDLRKKCETEKARLQRRILDLKQRVQKLAVRLQEDDG